MMKHLSRVLWISLTLFILLSQSGCALAYYIHAKDEKLRREVGHETRCKDIEILQRSDEQVRVRACGAIYNCHFVQDYAPTSPLSTEHGHWHCDF